MDLERLDKYMRRFVQPHVTRRPGANGGDRNEFSPLGQLIRAAFGPPVFDEFQPPHVVPLREGAKELFREIQDRPGRWDISTSQYVLGYESNDLEDVPPTHRERLQQWHECLGDAFKLAGVEDGLTGRERVVFLARVKDLVVKVAPIAADSDASWIALKGEPKVDAGS
jgi:hypothetical protein